MKVRWVRLLARPVAGMLLFQATAPAGIAAKQAVDVALARRRARAALRAAALRPPKAMKGVPTIKAVPAVPPLAAGLLATDRVPGRPVRGEVRTGTILNEVGRLDEPLADGRRAAWRAELGGPVPAARAAWLRLWLAEADLARRYPQAAVERLDALLRTRPEAAVRGAARLDRAEALFRMGRYGDARRAFEALLASREVGYERRNAALWVAHARSCEGYHAGDARLGAPALLRIDPLGGAAALGACLRGLGLPYAKETLARTVAHTGEGSGFQELADACGRLGLAANPLRATEKGLRALPLPAVARVEGDHFVAVVETDAKGVEFVCSDCGAWPGGPVRVSWRAWRAMKPGAFMTVTRPGSAGQAAMDRVAPSPASAVRGAVDVSLGLTQGPLAGEAARIASRLAGAVGPLALGDTGTTGDALHCPEAPSSDECGAAEGDLGPSCRMDASGAGASGPASGDPVNLATLEEEYRSAPDVTVYNPTGPSVRWSHLFDCLSSYASGLGYGWSHPYNVGVAMAPATGGGGTIQPRTDVAAGGGGDDGSAAPSATSTTTSGQIVFENGARIAITASSSPGAGNPTVDCAVPAGVRLKVQWRYDSSTGKDRIEVTFPDRTKWTAGDVAPYPVDWGLANFRPLSRIDDRVGNWIGFAYATYQSPLAGDGAMVPVTRLTGISDSAGASLLSLSYNSNGFLASANDRYGRHVYYALGTYSRGQNAPPTLRKRYDELTGVSQITDVAPGAGYPNNGVPARYAYTYVLDPTSGTAPSLRTMTVPSPTGSGTSTTNLYYNPDGTVARVVDANGFQHAYLKQDYNGAANSGMTTVQVKDASGTVVAQSTTVLDSTMGWTAIKDAQGRTVATQSFGGANTAYKPTTVTNALNASWSYVYDAHANRTSATTPRSTTTTTTWDYTNFSLGEVASVKEGAKTATTLDYYEPSGLVQDVTTPVPGESGTGNGQTTSFTYTAMGQVATVMAPGNNATTTRTTSYNYTTDGGYTQPERLGQPIVVTNELGKKWRMGYDARGNLEVAYDPLNDETDFFVNLADQTTLVYGAKTGSTGTGSSATATTYLYPDGPATQVDAKDESGAVVRTVNVAYGLEGETLSRTGSAETVSLAYDAAYRTRTVTDGNGHATSYAYDANGNLAEIDYPLASGTNYDRIRYTSYDAEGDLLSRTDGVGQVTNYAYDSDGLLNGIDYAGASNPHTGFTHDAYGRLTQTSSNVDLGGYAGESTTYDDLDDVKTDGWSAPGFAQATTFTYAYWPDGSRKSMVNPAGTWSYAYDAAGRYVSMSSPAGTSFAAYLDNGWQTSRQLPNGAYTQYAYNALGIATRATNHAAGGATLSDFQATGFDGAFNLTGLASTVAGVSAATGTTTYQYDSKDRLTQETSGRLGGYSQPTAYDGAGNLTTVPHANFPFSNNADNERVRTDIGGAYDGNGNPTVYNGPQGHDVEGRLSYVAANDGVSTAFTAGYRWDGLRAWKADGSGTRTYFLYDGGDPVLEVDAGGNVVGTNVFAPDGLVARTSGGTTRQYTFDLQGSVAQRLDASGSAQSTSSADAWGWTQDGDASDPFAFDGRWGYYRDAETGYYLCGERYYDYTGRWLTRDPIGYEGGVNLYGYCTGGPVGAADPEGLKIKWDIQNGSYASAREIYGWLLRIAGGSDTGRDIARDILFGCTEYTITVDDKSRFGSSYHDPSHRFRFSRDDIDNAEWQDTDGNWQDFNWMRVVDHEIGHTKENSSNHGDKDPKDRGGEQATIDKYENPISAELGDKRKRANHDSRRKTRRGV